MDIPETRDEYLVRKIAEIEAHLISGDGLGIAKKKVFKSPKLMIMRDLMLHPNYVLMLNTYLSNKHNNQRFYVDNGRLLRRKRSD